MTNHYAYIVDSINGGYPSFGFWNISASTGFGMFMYNGSIGFGATDSNGQGISGTVFQVSPGGDFSLSGTIRLGTVNSDPASIIGGIEMYPGFGGFGVTANTLNYNWQGVHQFTAHGVPIFYLEDWGMQMQSALYLQSDPTSAMMAATKQYVDNAIAAVNAKLGSSQWDVGVVSDAAGADPLAEMRATIATLTARIAALENRAP